MRISDRIAEILVENSIVDTFMVTGGGAMHLNDALSRNDKITVTNMHHEQACSMAADGYTRLSNKIACVNVTTGPGGINAINGVYGAWTDSLPMIVLSGQVKRETLNYQNSDLRQLGDQENDIVSMVKKITKFSYILKNPNLTDSIMDHAIQIAKSGRPGPVWIDVPIDIQGATYVKENQLAFSKEVSPLKTTNLSEDIRKLIKLINNSKRPAIIVGGGIRAANAHSEFMKFINKTSIPVLTAWNAHDVIFDDHTNYAGRPGTVGDRAGNFIAENCDLLLILGSRLNIRQIGYNYKKFSPNSFKVMVDIDNEELNKRTLNIDYKINTDLKVLLESLNKKVKNLKNKQHTEYLKWCKNLNYDYPVFQEKFKKSKNINPYHFVDELFNVLQEDDIVVTSDGTAVVTTFQGAKLKPGQRLFSNSGSASMGFGLPAAIGASISNNNSEIICIEGDGSIQMNIQELATVGHHNLPIKIFILSNEGYHSIRQTQTKYFSDNITGCGPESGLSFPDFEKISLAYGIKFKEIKEAKNLRKSLQEVISHHGPIVCSIKLDKEQEFEPKASSKLYPDGRMKSAPLYDLYPFLDTETVEEIINYRP
jgi:acetolactate synthase-1/2/3 large subunit